MPTVPTVRTVPTVPTPEFHRQRAVGQGAIRPLLQHEKVSRRNHVRYHGRDEIFTVCTRLKLLQNARKRPESDPCAFAWVMQQLIYVKCCGAA